MTDFAEFHTELRSVAGDLLAEEATVAWPVLAQAGWTGLEIPDDAGGAGATFAEVAIVCEEMGRAATRSSYLGGAVLGVGMLNMMPDNDIRDKLLTGLASGEKSVAVVLDGIRLANGYLTGRAEFVPDADEADQLLVVAADGDGAPVVVHTAGLTVTPQPVLDDTRRFATVTADDVAVDGTAVWRFTGDPDAQLRRLRDRAAVAIACDSLGVSEAMLAATVAYAKVRHQFGRSIGSFQAVKHACADMAVQVSVARRLVDAAVTAVTEDRADASSVVSMAKSYATEAAVAVAGKAMQLHGGIGYTWESGIHVYLKRATLNRALFGSPAAHRRQLSDRYARDD